ncbi:hypothetical protein [Nocardioides sp. YIM 152315]|uniref:hypothetical protein n=1 Tax=Nocardioides sp. YIM 152315 TaxID=3031760 RepID=UPI0023DBDB62|nr:hypothetical protein [Nocardioides sp. YIM 152315]MDF1606086.1 hypothetical protein [Nocardioides sp. YIM 152315]
MTAVRRWSVVVAGTLLLVAAIAGVHRLPAAESDVGAAELLRQVRGAEDHSWSGYIETEGALQLPDTDGFSDVGALFGERTTMRAWWHDGQHWRVAQLLLAGETDLIHRGDTTLRWDYERFDATLSRDPAIRLPRTADLVPPVLAARLLRGVDVDDVERIPAKRTAGVSAPGLRLVPPSDLSSIDHADVWLDPGSGVPLRVEVHADGADSPAFTSQFREFSSARPSTDEVSFEPPPGVEVGFDDVLDIADAANQYASVRPPDRVAGLERAASSDQAVGVYGRGMTEMIAIPIRDREADPLREQLAQTAGVDRSAERTAVSVGPLGVVLTGAAGEGGWLLAGTLTREALDRAADDVLADSVFLGDR